MYGKIFTTMFGGSLYGKGPLVLSLWAYVIANQTPDKKQQVMQVELNPEQLRDILGGGTTEADVVKAIEFFCSPDPKSRTKEKEGRRLIKLSEYDYEVVNGAKYRAIRNEEERREQTRLAVARHRAKKAGVKPSHSKTAAEANYETQVQNGDIQK